MTGRTRSSGIEADIVHQTFPQYLSTVRRFTHGELIPAERRLVSERAVPPEIFGRIKGLGLFGITLPRAWGGLGWSMEEQVLLTMEFTQASVVYRSLFSTTIGLCSQLILDYGTERQRRELLPLMSAGDCVAAFALTEPGAGTDVRAVSTVATPTGSGYSISGVKRFITNGASADLLIVAAKVAGNDPGALSVFVVDPRSPGVTREAAATMNGHEAGPVAEVRLADVRVEADCLVGGEEGRGLRQLLRGINHARTHVAATAVGQGIRLMNEAAAHCRQRVQFGRPLAELEVVQNKIGRCYAELIAARSTVLSCARKFDRETEVPRHDISAAKYFATEVVSRIADTVLQVLGGEGIVGDHPVPRMWRDVRALRIYEGASEIHERNLGRRALSVFDQHQDPFAQDCLPMADQAVADHG